MNILYTCYETSQTMSKSEWRNYYNFSGAVDHDDYPSFIDWWHDMRKSGVIEIA